MPLENLEGKAVVNFWSTDGSAQWLLPWTWFTAARWSRIGARLLTATPSRRWIGETFGRKPADLAAVSSAR